jgi:hypothetical protein
MGSEISDFGLSNLCASASILVEGVSVPGFVVFSRPPPAIACPRMKIYREIFEQYWQYVPCMPGRNPHHWNAAWRLVVESWLRRQGWIAIRQNNQTNVSTIS